MSLPRPTPSEIKRISELSLKPAVLLAVKRICDLAVEIPAVIVDQEEIVTRAEDVVEADVVSPKVVRVVELNDRAGKPLVIEVVIHTSIDDVVCESATRPGFICAARSRKGGFVEVILRLNRDLIRQPNPWIEHEAMQSTAPIIANVPSPVDELSGDPSGWS